MAETVILYYAASYYKVQRVNRHLSTLTLLNLSPSVINLLSAAMSVKPRLHGAHWDKESSKRAEQAAAATTAAGGGGGDPQVELRSRRSSWCGAVSALHRRTRYARPAEQVK